MVQHIIVAGGTGLVGTEVLRALVTRRGVQVTALVRRLTKTVRPPHIVERAFDFGNPGDYQLLGSPSLPCDVLICCVGTTIRKAGTREAFEQVDRYIPAALAHGLAQHQAKAVFGLVSAVGAERPHGFYLQTKAAAEAAVKASGLRYVIVRPSLLLGERQEFRLGEHLGGVLMRPLFAAADLLGLNSIGAVARIHPVQAKQLAGVLIEACLDRPPRDGHVLAGKDLFRAAF